MAFLIEKSIANLNPGGAAVDSPFYANSSLNNGSPDIASLSSKREDYRATDTRSHIARSSSTNTRCESSMRSSAVGSMSNI